MHAGCKSVFICLFSTRALASIFQQDVREREIVIDIERSTRIAITTIQLHMRRIVESAYVVPLTTSMPSQPLQPHFALRRVEFLHGKVRII